MNPYFICFSLYSLMIIPMTLRFRLRLGRRSGYRLRFQAVGLPFVRKRTSDDSADEQPIQEQDVAQTLADTDMALVRAVLRRPVQKKLWKMLHWKTLELSVRFSFKDAAQTALSFCIFRSLLETLHTVGALPSVLNWRVDANFNGEGTEAFFQGIVTFRLGSLLPAAAMLTSACLSAREETRKTNRPQATDAHT